ncbi:hypothetical protein LUZ60_003494 [Juncus effusus]|nr:hypothetical protein LUZ60_003494 [Juncus effusus]
MPEWDSWLDSALSTLASSRLLRSARPIALRPVPAAAEEIQTFDGPGPWDRSSVEVELEEETFCEWVSDLPSCGSGRKGQNGNFDWKLVLFSGNDYSGLSTHPSVRKAASKAAEEHGMGPRGSALICGYTNYHKMLESSLAELKKKEDCILCPTGFSANLAFMSALGSITQLNSPKPNDDNKIAIFSDELNHASIIDGIRLVQKQNSAKVFVYRHCDIFHLDLLLSSCKMRRKVVITDSLFSMDGDFAPLIELVELKKKHGFLLAIDDAHATLICGQNGGGAAEQFKCEKQIDICIGTLSKAVGCHGGFIACSKKWKKLIQSRGRSFIFSTSIPVPVAAASLVAIHVGKREKWRRENVWRLVREFRTLTGINITSPIISIVVGNETAALSASRHMLESGFHVTAIRPPTVAPNSCRLRITLSAAHTLDDVRKLVDALLPCIKLNTNQNSVQISRL